MGQLVFWQSNESSFWTVLASFLSLPYEDFMQEPCKCVCRVRVTVLILKFFMYLYYHFLLFIFVWWHSICDNCKTIHINRDSCKCKTSLYKHEMYEKPIDENGVSLPRRTILLLKRKCFRKGKVTYLSNNLGQPSIN